MEHGRVYHYNRPTKTHFQNVGFFLANNLNSKLLRECWARGLLACFLHVHARAEVSSMTFSPPLPPGASTTTTTKISASLTPPPVLVKTRYRVYTENSNKFCHMNHRQCQPSIISSVVDPDPHGSGTFAWIRNSENSELDPDPEYIIPDPQHWL